MIRRRVRTAKQKDMLAYKQAASIGIGETRDEQKAREDAAEATVIQSVHDEVFSTRPHCQLCRGARVLACMGLPDQMHEDPPRSATRGLPPQDRFNVRVCGRICVACHADVTENRIRIVFDDPVNRFAGPIHGVAA